MTPDAPEVQQPKGPETQEDPVLIEAEEALKRADEKEDRQRNTLRIQLLDTSLANLAARIELTKREDPSNYDKLQRLAGKRAEVSAKREELLKRADERADESMREVESVVKAHGEQLDKNVAEMQRLTDEKAKLTTELTPALEASTKPEDVKRVGEIYAALKANQEAMQALEAQGTQEKQKAQAEAAHAMELKAHAMVEAEHKDQEAAADRMLSEYVNGTNEDQDKKKEDTKSDEDKPESFTEEDWQAQVSALEEETTLQELKDVVSKYALDTKDAQELKTKAFVEALEKVGMKPEEKFKDFLKDGTKKEKVMSTLNTKEKGPGIDKKKVYDNIMHQTCLDLATEMAGNVPKDDDTVGKTFFEIKRMGLMILSAFGGSKWVESLNEDQRKALGMEVTPVEKEGEETKYKVKWSKIDFSLIQGQEVYKEAFGEDAWAEQMKGLTPDTKISDLKKQVDAFPADTKDPKQLQMKQFVTALEAAGATPDTKVQEFLGKDDNTDKVMKMLNPQGKPADKPADSKDEPEKSPDLKDYLKVIEDNKFTEKTTVAEFMTAFNKTDHIDNIGLIATMTPEALDKLKVGPDLTEPKLKELYGSMNTPGLDATMKTLGIKPASFSEDLYKKASAEITAGTLNDDTQAEINKVVETFIEAAKAFASTTLKDYVTKLGAEATGEDKQNRDAILEALKKNPLQ